MLLSLPLRQTRRGGGLPLDDPGKEIVLGIRVLKYHYNTS